MSKTDDRLKKELKKNAIRFGIAMLFTLVGAALTLYHLIAIKRDLFAASPTDVAVLAGPLVCAALWLLGRIATKKRFD